MQMRFLALISVVALLACAEPSPARPSGYSLELKPGLHANLQCEGVAYDLYVPDLKTQSAQSYRLLLVLPGWKFDKSRWYKETSLKQFADANAMILILPQMNISLYASQYFPQTTMKWHRYPGLVFVNQHLIPELHKKYGFFQKGMPNFLLGLSTGGRGVAQIALSNPGLFRAGASLSGDYDQSVMPGDNLMRAVYGPYEKFKERWKTIDNPQHAAADWAMPLYLAHGTADKIVPPSQTQRLYDAIVSAKGKEFPVQLDMVPGAGHDFHFWNSRLKASFAFFSKYYDQ
ncbi:MAG: prolyl oligopeptidase family serine peptidase [Leptospiraceae bacterium]|nr:prolyl oligopeptidase family serine peptidase [Leptospiraceae bacterium]